MEERGGGRSCHDSTKVGDHWNTSITSGNVFDEDNKTADVVSCFVEFRLTASWFSSFRSKDMFLDG